MFYTSIHEVNSIPIYVSKSLGDVLTRLHDTKIDEYNTAYGGESVGLDLYSTDKEDIVIQGALGNKLISTGLFIALPKNYEAQIKERGSITKTPCAIRAGVVDPGYCGEIFVSLATYGNEKYTVRYGQKLPVQLVTSKVATNYYAISRQAFEQYIESTKRKNAYLGSTN